MFFTFVTTVPIVRDAVIVNKMEILPMSVFNVACSSGIKTGILLLAEAPYSYFRYIFVLLTLKVLIDIGCICCYPYKKDRETDPR